MNWQIDFGDVVSIANALHAEVERLKETQRKLARLIIIAQLEVKPCVCGELDCIEAQEIWNSAEIAAAIKEAEK